MEDKQMRKGFAAYELKGLEERPQWWQVRPDEINRIMRGIRHGKVETLCKTASGHPLWAVTYNSGENAATTVNWPAAGSSSNPDKFRSRGYERQTVVICAGLHGAEPEGVAAALNLINLIESGSDLRGERNEVLRILIENYTVVIMPCVNMDGRSICPDHLRGATYEQFRIASQGMWNDGKYINWQESKEYFPLPLERVAFPGGYPNQDGFNIMHDCAPGCLRTAEAAAILALAEREQTDLFLNLHSCEGSPVLLPPGMFNYAAHVERGNILHRKLMDKLKQHRLINDYQQPWEHNGYGINLNTAVTMCSGALALTYESTVTDQLTFDQMLETHYILFETVLADGLREKFSPRSEIIKAKEKQREAAE
jgi:hypothetical protein